MLIVDDSCVFRAALRDFLSAYHLNVVGEAGSGEQAVDLARKLAPDVAFVDLRMPGMDGLETCHRIRAASADVRLVLISASPRELRRNFSRSEPYTILAKHELLQPDRAHALMAELFRRPVRTPA